MLLLFFFHCLFSCLFTLLILFYFKVCMTNLSTLLYDAEQKNPFCHRYPRATLESSKKYNPSTLKFSFSFFLFFWFLFWTSYFFHFDSTFLLIWLVPNCSRDGRMTIRLVLKYLVNKLQLENESEVCKVPFLLYSCSFIYFHFTLSFDIFLMVLV